MRVWNVRDGGPAVEAVEGPGIADAAVRDAGPAGDNPPSVDTLWWSPLGRPAP